MPMRKAQPGAGNPGSPAKGEPVYLAVGMLRRPHGVRGELLMEVHTDFPERLKPGLEIFVGEARQPMTLDRVRGHKDGLLVGFAGIETPEAAGLYRNTHVYVTAKDRPRLPDGVYYHHEILGLRVLDDTGRELGVLTEILVTGANDVFVVTRPGGDELLIPSIPETVLEISPEARQIRVHLLPGLEGGADEV